MDQKDLISVIIPVYNGEKYLKKTIPGILNQSYKNIELILVPNNCRDNSVAICNDWAKKDNRVKVFVNDEKGTSLARKRGVLESKGKYIVFSDQDDKYTSNRAIEKMYDAIVEDGTQIVEFNTYYEPIPHIIRQRKYYKTNKAFTRKELFDGPLSGAVVGRGDYFSTSVWSKIYSGDMLRKAVKNINASLYFAEDSYLNLFAFTNNDVKNVSVRNQAYYIWKYGGFSKTSGANTALLHDYTITKVDTVNLLNQLNVNPQIILRVFSEGLWCYRATINGLLRSEESKESNILELITELENTEYIRMTKAYFRTHPDAIWTEEMNFMISDYTPEEYLNWCREHLPPLTRRQKIKSFVRKLIQ